MLKADQAGLFVDTTRTLFRRGRASFTSFRARWSLATRVENASDMLFCYPSRLRIGNRALGEALLAGDLSIGGGRVEMAALPEHMFTMKPPNDNWARAAYSFDWLCDLLATQQPQAIGFISRSILHFCHARLDRQFSARAPDIIARRLMRWSLFVGAARDQISIVDRNLILFHAQRDARLLAQLSDSADEGKPRLEAALGQALTALWLANCIDMLRPAMDTLSKEFRRQVLPDGGPTDRAPETLFNLLADAQALMVGLRERDISPPSFLEELVPRMENMLMFLTLSDGALAQFHGGTMRSAAEVAAHRPSGKSKVEFKFAQRTGYQRLDGGKSTVLVDSGSIPKGPFAREAHLSPLAFEFSHGDDRIFVNCGTCRLLGEQWNLATRGIGGHTTAHFTREVHDPFLTEGIAGKTLGPRLIAPEFDVTTRRTDSNDGMWLDGHHNYFALSHGYTALKRLYLSADGMDFRGQDRFVPLTASAPRRQNEYVVRFHLHPDISASLQAGGMACLLITRSGRGWQFRAKGPAGSTLHLEPSIYMGPNGYPEKTQQIVLAGQADDEIGMRWALKFAGQLRRRR